MLILIIIAWWLVLSLVLVFSLLVPFHFFSENKTNQKFCAKQCVLVAQARGGALHL